MCVKLVSYSIVVNGKPCKLSSVAEGNRQGDPILSFLFAIAMKYLSRLLEELPNNPKFKFLPRCSKNKITHLLFADDLLLFNHGSLEFINAMMECFFNFSKCSVLMKILISVRLHC